MIKRYTAVIFVALFTLVLLLIGWWLLPQAVDTLPGQIRGRLPESFLAVITTPLPAALPTPASKTLNADMPELAITIVLPEATESPAWIPVQATKPARADSPRPTLPATVRPDPLPTQNPTATSEPTSTPLPQSARIGDINVIPQKFNNCGPANLTMVLNHFGEPADQLEVGGILKPNYDDRNVSPYELVDYVNNHTALSAAAFSGGDLSLIKVLIAAEFPLLVEKGLYLSELQGWMGHYLTLIGYDDGKRVFHSLDSFLGPWDGSGRNIYYEDLEEQWVQFNHTFIVVYPAGKEQLLHELIGEQLWDEASMWRHAAQQAQTEIEQDPLDAYAWFNLGTNLTQLGKLGSDEAYFEAAATAFDRAREIGLPWRMLWYQFEPFEAYLAVDRLNDVLILAEATLSNSGGRQIEEAYLYQGHAYLVEGRLSQARDAYKRALKLNPNFKPAQDALADVESIAAAGRDAG